MNDEAVGSACIRARSIVQATQGERSTADKVSSLGLDALGDELEEPFGSLPNDLPIITLADTIEINLREALSETDLPPLPQPDNYMLM